MAKRDLAKTWPEIAQDGTPTPSAPAPAPDLTPPVPVGSAQQTLANIITTASLASDKLSADLLAENEHAEKMLKQRYQEMTAKICRGQGDVLPSGRVVPIVVWESGPSPWHLDQIEIARVATAANATPGGGGSANATPGGGGSGRSQVRGRHASSSSSSSLREASGAGATRRG